jgi:hypothetical protein
MSTLVMPGLDPGIHQSSQDHFSKKMDCRVKPGNDGVGEGTRLCSMSWQGATRRNNPRLPRGAMDCFAALAMTTRFAAV